MRLNERQVVENILRGKPSPARQAFREFAAKEKERERRRERSDSRKRARAIDLMGWCEKHGQSLALCDCL